MSLWREFFTDPVIFFSFTGLAVLLGLCIFYAWFFIKKAGEAEQLGGQGSDSEKSKFSY